MRPAPEWYAGKKRTTSSMQHGTRLAAIDLGSNSFRLEIVRLDHGQFERAAYFKESIRQGSGLDAERNLSPEAMQRGWDCLARFGEQLAGFQPAQVRAVATQTLREARNRDVFLARANQILGFPIDVISGRDEARLIFQGVAQMLPRSDERRLVADIGGRSTELILGQGFTPKAMDSYHLGSISWSSRYFPQGQFTPQAFQNAEVAAQAVLDEALNTCGPQHWDAAYGSAGTIGAVADVLQSAGWPAGVVTRAGLDWLRDQLLEAGSADRLRLAGMKEDRRPIIGGGVSILRAIFILLEIDSMQAALGGLRHGLLCELTGSGGQGKDLRQRSIQRLVSKFGPEQAQAQRVQRVALALLRQMLPAALSQEEHEVATAQLGWAAELHEIGTAVAHVDHHKHGAYLLDHMELSGFSMTEMHRLSLLVLGQRGKPHKLDADLDDGLLVRQLLALRLAVVLCHARRDPDTQGLLLSCDDGPKRRLVLRSPAGWMGRFPQSAHLLREEENAWQKTPWSFSYSPLT